MDAIAIRLGTMMSVHHRWIVGLCILGSPLILAQSPGEGGVILQGGTVHTISGKVIENGSMLIRNWKIVGVGQGISAPAGFKAIDVRGQHVYPGIDRFRFRAALLRSDSLAVSCNRNEADSTS